MTPEESHVEIRKVGHRWIDLSAAACALVVSVTSLFVAIRHGKAMERMAEANAKLVQANSWPLLQRFQSDEDPEGSHSHVFSLYVINNGVGPAKVEQVEVTWKGQPVRTARELIRLCCVKDQDVSEPAVETSGLMGSVLRAGEIRRVIEFPEDAVHDSLTQGMRVSLQDIEWKTCYCSVFDECWLSDLKTMNPQSVSQCPAAKVPFKS
jgi:hypothetical protein